jgi:uncharacterized membrane protein (Fun14 family)
MSTVDSTFLIIGTVCISLFFLALFGLTVYTWTTFHRLARRTEAALSGVEAASHLIREAGKRGAFMPLFGMLKYIFQSRSRKD